MTIILINELVISVPQAWPARSLDITPLVGSHERLLSTSKNSRQKNYCSVMWNLLMA